MTFAIILALLLQVEPIPDPVPNGDVFTGPLESLREAIVERLDKRAAEDKELMQGLLDRWKEHDGTDAARYHGLRGLLEEIRNRELPDNAPLFPRFAELRADIKAAKEAQEMGTGPIREALGMLTQLVYALIILAGVLLLVDVYRTFFRKAA